jgi:nucleoside-diphosphate kinase
MERTLVLVKPDGVQRGLVGEIIRRLEVKGLKLAGLKLVSVSRELAERHYAVHLGKSFYPGLIEYITSGPVVAMVLEGPRAIEAVRKVVGATRSYEAEPGSIRGALALTVARNLVHASDGPETAAAEVDLWFPAGDLLAYERDVDRWITPE